MSKKTLYYCDNCKKEVNEGELTDIKIELDPYTTYKTRKFESVYKYFDICSDCTERLGFVKIVKKDGEKIPEPTTADKLYDLIADMICEITG